MRREHHRDKFSDAHDERLRSLARSGGVQEDAIRDARDRENELFEEDEYENDDATAGALIPRSNPALEAELLSSRFKEGVMRHPDLQVVDADDEEEDDYEIEFRGAYSDSESDSDSGGEGSDSGTVERKEFQKRLVQSVPTAVADEVNERTEEAKEALEVQSRRAGRLASDDFSSFFLSSVAAPSQGDSLDSTAGSVPSSEAIEGAVLLTEEEKARFVNAEAPELVPLIDDLKKNFEVAVGQLAPVLRKTKKKKEYLTPRGRRFLELKFLVTQAYSTNILYYLALRASGALVKIHPVMKRLVQLRDVMKRLMMVEKSANVTMNEIQQLFDAKMMPRRRFGRKKPKKPKVRVELEGPSPESIDLAGFDSLQDVVQHQEDQDQDQSSLTGKKRSRKELGKKAAPKRRKRSLLQERFHEDRELYDSHSQGDRRNRPNEDILKSKGLREQGRGFLHPRIKHRARFFMKTKKKRALDRRYDAEKGGGYSGEGRIQKRLVRSRKIKS